MRENEEHTHPSWHLPCHCPSVGRWPRGCRFTLKRLSCCRRLSSREANQVPFYHVVVVQHQLGHPHPGLGEGR